MLKNFKFNLSDVECAACIEPVKGALKNKKWELGNNERIQITALSINLLRKTFEIEVDSEGVTDAFIQKFVTDELAEVGVTADSTAAPHVLKAIIGIVSGAGFLLLSIFGGGLPLIATYILTAISTTLSLYLGKEIFVEAFKKTTRLHTLDMNALFSVSAVTAMTVSIASFFVPWMPCMLDAALLIFGFRHLGLAIEDKAKQQVIDSMSFKERAPRKILLGNKDGEFEECNVDEVKVGDIICVQPGQIIPLDGKCLSAAAKLDISIIDGSIKSTPINAGAEIFAGMKLNSAMPIKIEVKKIEAESHLARMDAEILQAESDKMQAPLEASAQKILKYFVPAVFILTIVIATGVSFVAGAAMAIKCAISLLVSACPCTLGSIVPLAVTVAIEKAAKENVLFKSGEALQAAAETDIVVFDLNGTLTEGKFQVNDIQFMDNKLTSGDKKYLYYCLYELEKNATHPMGITIRKKLEEWNFDKFSFNSAIDDDGIVHHAGRKLFINNECFRIGNVTMMKEADIKLGRYEIFPQDKPPGQVLFLARDNKLVARIIMTDSLKRDAGLVISELKKRGKDVHICTGVDRETALRYVDQLNANQEVIAEANLLADCYSSTSLPGKNSKKAYIVNLQNEGKKKVAMIGDQDNDVVPMAASDVGIFVKSAANAEMMGAKADVIIQSSSLLPVLTTFDIADDMVSNIKQNMFMSFGYNFTTFCLDMGCWFGLGLSLNPAIGVAMMILQASVVFLNVYRFKQSALVDHEGETSQSLEQNEFTNATTHFIHHSLGISPSQTPEAKTSSPINNVVPLLSTSCPQFTSLPTLEAQHLSPQFQRK